MFVAPNEARYFLPVDEKQAITSLSLSRWEKVYVQSGRISSKWLVERHVYSVGSIVVETESRLLILLDSEELEDGTELFRLAVVANQDELKGMLSRMRPPVRELTDVPSDLNIKSFLDVDNEVSLLRFHETLGEGAKQVNAETESGLLVSNSNGRLLLYPNEETPLELCITTDAEKIDAVLSRVEVVPFS